MCPMVWTKNAAPLAAVVVCGLVLAACDSAPPAAERKPQSRPAAQEKQGPSPTAPTGSVATSQPATPEPPATQPATTQPATTQPAEAEAKPPEYITIIERFEPQRRASVEARREDGNRLVIETRNVRRMRIDRTRAELNLRRSVALQIDGQGLEWLAKSEVTDFERSVNGEWQPVKPTKP